MTLLEQARSLFADLERNVFKISDELQHKAVTKKQSVHQDHRIKYYLEQIQKDAKNLKVLYQDEGRVFENQVRGLTIRSDLNGTIHSFEKSIRDIQLFYQEKDEKGGKGTVLGTLNERNEQQLFDLPFYERCEKEQQFMEKHGLLPTFTSDERYGKYVDLGPNYIEFQSLRKVQQCLKRKLQSKSMENSVTLNQSGTSTAESESIQEITNYSSFLKSFHHFEWIDYTAKDQEYLEYVKGLYNYFIDFFQRTQPLNQIEKEMAEVEERFKVDWENGNALGWSEYISQQNAHSADNNNVQNKPQKTKRNRRGGKRKRLSLDTYFEIARLEAKINYFAIVFHNEIIATQRYYEKKQTFTWEELQAELERDEEMESKIPEEEKVRQVKEKADESADKNRILDDESTMPLWLYKQRGLNIEYKCEICGNYSYRGPMVFKKHFQEWRHQHGMNCLHIPNSKHFFGITSIKEALELWEKMKHDKMKEEFHTEQMEVEDEMGNVYDLKTFEDLKKQGLL